MSGDYFAAGIIISIGAVLLVLAFVIVDSGGVDYSDENRWEYEDYRLAPDGMLGVSGPLEIVKFGGQDYIHAYDKGAASIVYSDGKVDKILVEPAKADIIIIDGQSNSAYSLPNSTLAVPPQIGTSFYFGWNNDMPKTIGQSLDGSTLWDFTKLDGTCRVGDKGPEFCKTWYEQTGHKCIWLSLGVGGKIISTWDQPNGSMWTWNKEVMEAANKVIDGLPFDIDKTVVLWAQGESDYAHDTGYDNYIQRFTTLHDSAPDAWGRKIDAWFMIEGRTENVGWVNTAFEQLSATIPDVSIAVKASLIDSFTQNNLLMASDDLHYTQRGDNAVANCAARTATEAGGEAPVYLVQTIYNGDTGVTGDLAQTSPAYTTGKVVLNLPVTWETVDWTESGTQVVNGTVITDRLILNAPVVLIVTLTVPEESP